MRPSSATLLISSFVIPSAGYALLYASSARFREWVHNMDVRKLTLLQASRMVGTVMFAYQHERGRIPGQYGLTTAASDFVAGTTAPAAAACLSERALRVWHWLGFAGLIVAGGSGILTSPTRVGVLTRWKTSQPTASFPLVLAPALFGPAVLIAHLMALTNLSRESVRS